MKEIIGGTPYGASTITDSQGQRMPSANELGDREIPGKARDGDRSETGCGQLKQVRGF